MDRYLQERLVWDSDEQAFLPYFGIVGADPLTDPLGISSRPSNPRRIEGDENRVPDLIFSVDNPAEDYLTGKMLGYRYPENSKLTYVCSRYLKAGDSNCFKIQLSIEYTDSVFGETTSILYPNGLDSYNFDPTKVREYYFTYKY